MVHMMQKLKGCKNKLCGESYIFALFGDMDKVDFFGNRIVGMINRSIRNSLKNKTQKMEKITMSIIMPNATGSEYIEEIITKNAWKCLVCGRVWKMKYDAEDCEHDKDFYTVSYGGYYENGRHIGGHDYVISIVRKENV